VTLEQQILKLERELDCDARLRPFRVSVRDAKRKRLHYLRSKLPARVPMRTSRPEVAVLWVAACAIAD
jgi:hypothetical protein